MTACIAKPLLDRADALVAALCRSGETLVTAESCTGGLVAACLSQCPRAGECLQGGFIVYSKAQKTEALGVDPQILAQSGAVNSETACQMAEGALHRSRASLAVAITGVLGPDADEDGNPPGLVFLAIARRGQPTRLARHDLPYANPQTMCEQTVVRAFEMVFEVLR